MLNVSSRSRFILSEFCHNAQCVGLIFCFVFTGYWGHELGGVLYLRACAPPALELISTMRGCGRVLVSVFGFLVLVEYITAHCKKKKKKKQNSKNQKCASYERMYYVLVARSVLIGKGTRKRDIDFI